MKRFSIKAMLLFTLVTAVVVNWWSISSELVLSIGQNGRPPTDCIVYFHTPDDLLVAVAIGENCRPSDLYRDTVFLGFRNVSVNGEKLTEIRRDSVQVFFFDGNNWKKLWVPRRTLGKFSSNKQSIFLDSPKAVVDEFFRNRRIGGNP